MRHRQLFTPAEDMQLCSLVACLGARNWDEIAKQMPGRTGRQCRDRYKNYLSPEISTIGWTYEEERLLAEKYAEFGPKWSKIAEFFQGRTGTALKNRWRYHVSRRTYEPSSQQSTDESSDMSSSEPSPVERVFRSLEASLQDIFDDLVNQDELSSFF